MSSVLANIPDRDPGVVGSTTSVASAASASQVEAKVAKVVFRWRGGDLAEGLLASKFIRAIPLTGLAVGALYLVPFFITGFSPAVWMIIAVVAGGYAVGLLVQMPFCKGFQKAQFEISSLGRSLRRKNYNEIVTVDTPHGPRKIFLGAIPNRLQSDGEKLVNDEDVKALLSLNEPWERDPLGLSLPYSDSDWAELRVVYKSMDVPDHTLLSKEQLNEVADFIAEQLQAGKNVYVHCRAGNGRSGMAVAAYLIKYRGKTAKEAAELIKGQRSSATIYKKLERLKVYEYFVRQHVL